MDGKGKKIKPFFLNLKIAAGTFTLVIMLFAAAHDAKSALIDWAKHEEWRRKQLEALVAEVKLKGFAPYVIMSFHDYDTNNDRLIDADESKAIEAVLSKPQTAATKPKK